MSIVLPDIRTRLDKKANSSLDLVDSHHSSLCARVLRCQSLLLILLAVALLLLSQPVLSANSPRIENPRLMHLDASQGLSQNTINALHIDAYGFLWVGNEEGLNRYDGHKVIQIPGESGEFLNNPVYKIFQDSRNIFWISTGLSGIYQFDPITRKTNQVISREYLDDPNWQQFAQFLTEVDNAEVLIAFNQQVDLFSHDANKVTTLYQLPEERLAKGHTVRAAYKSGDMLLIGTSFGLLSKNLKTGELVNIEFLSENNNGAINENQLNVKQLMEMPNGRLWIGTVQGLHQIPLAELKQHVLRDWAVPVATTIDPNLNIWSLHFQNEDNIYLGTDIGIHKTDLSGSSPVFELLGQRANEEISNKSVRAIVTDSEGNLWFGSQFNGAVFWSPKSTLFFEITNHVNTKEGRKLSHNNVLALFQGDESTLWVGTTNGLNRVNLSSLTIEQFLVSGTEANLYGQENIKEIVSVNNRELWLSTGAGLRVFDKETKKLKDFSEFAPEQRRFFESYVWGLTREGSNVIWALSDAGLVRYDTNNWTAKEIEFDPLGLNVSTILKIVGFDIRTSNLLLSDAGRLVGLNTNTFEVKELHSLRGNGASLSVMPTSLLRDGRNNIWLSYLGKGLYQLNGNDFSQKNVFNFGQLFTTNLIYDIASDQQNHLWFSSHSGLHEFSPASQKLQTYGYMQGLSSSEFNEGAFARLQGGQLAYGSTKGVTIFTPSKVSALDREVNKGPVITEVALSSNPINLPYKNLNDSSIVMEHDDMGLVVYFSSLDYANIASDRFSYRLISNEKDINFPGSVSNKIEISMLNPGHHVLEIFEVSANESEASKAILNIRVKYATFWSPEAFIIYFLLGVLLLLWFIYRRRQINAVLSSANDRVTMYNKQLTSALKASNADIWEWSSQTNLISTPKMPNELGYEARATSIDFDRHLMLIHEADRLQYLSLWRQFLRGETEQFDSTYRIKNANGEYVWFRVAGSISSKEEGIIKVTGTFTNVTENIASKEQLKLFGDAFKHTRDWVLIFNSERQPLAGNPSFYKAFKLNDKADFKGQLTYIIDNQESMKHKFLSKLATLQAGEHWKTELEFVLGDKTVTTITDVNAIANDKDGRITEYYLVIMTDITEQKEAQNSLLRLASYDELTGLVNRTLLLEKLKQSILNARRHSTSVSVIFIDLDRFKPINDTFGHHAGDKVIIEIAQRISRKLRDNDIVSRLGGDEFVVVLEEIQDLQNVNKVVTELLALIERPIFLDSHSVSVSASAGVAMYPNDAVDAESLLRNADVAMYNAKESGKNAYQYFTAEMNDKVQQNMLLQNKLKIAVSRGEFENYYQPIIDTKTQKTAGFEMLMRWQSDNQFISPSTFIPVAEQIGLIVEMTIKAIERALHDISRWYEEGFEGYVAINLSAKQFSTRPDFEKIKDLLNAQNLPTSCLRFEITEGLLVDNNKNTIDYMHEMRDLGFKISLDDFGTGYSSLRYLKDFPIDVLKIDKSFVDDIGIDKGTESIIESTLIMTKMLDMDTVAEGIETKSQVDYFLQTNCHYLQGFYFSKPVSNKHCFDLLQKDWSTKFTTQSGLPPTIIKF